MYSGISICMLLIVPGLVMAQGCPPGYSSFSEECYITVNENMTWADAAVYCKEVLHSTLATPKKSWSEYSEATFLASITPHDASLWLGCVKMGTSDATWQCIDGTVLSRLPSWLWTSERSAPGRCLAYAEPVETEDIWRRRELSSTMIHPGWVEAECDVARPFVCRGLAPFNVTPALLHMAEGGGRGESPINSSASSNETIVDGEDSPEPIHFNNIFDELCNRYSALVVVSFAFAVGVLCMCCLAYVKCTCTLGKRKAEGYRWRYGPGPGASVTPATEVV
jgi:hypothetical protein